MLKIVTEIFFSDGLNIGLFFLLLYGIIPIGIGFYILFHLNQENQIEKIKEAKK